MATTSIESNLTAGLDPERLRVDFPILSERGRNGSPLVYLDNAATTQKPASVIAAVSDFYRIRNANVHRGLHKLAELSTVAYEDARRKVARFINAPSRRGVIFTRGTTESINLVAYAWGDLNVGAGDEILVSEMEHHSNLVPWQLLAQRRGAKLRAIPVDDAGVLDMEAYGKLLTGRVKLVSVAHMSNLLGTINPVREMARMAHAVGARIMLDAAQSVPHKPVDAQELGCDFLAFSGHKMCAPTGIGVLSASEELLDGMAPFMSGGEMISKVGFEQSTWAELPHKFEAGTPNVSGAIGLGAAIDYLESVGMEAIQAYEQELTAYTLEHLPEVPGLRLRGLAPSRGAVFAFEMEGIHPHDVAHLADEHGVALRAGHMCAQPMIRKLGLSALTRASLYFYNTRDEVDALIDALNKIRKVFNP